MKLSGLLALVLLSAQHAYAQQPVRVSGGVTVAVHLIPEGEYTRPSRLGGLDTGITAGVVLAPANLGPLRILADVDWQISPAEFRLSDAAGREIYTDYTVRDLTFAQLVGVELNRAARSGPV